MLLNIFIKSEEDLNILKVKNKETNKLTNYGKNKVHFKCSKCGCERTKAIQTLKFPLVCSNCNNQTAQLKPDIKEKIEKNLFGKIWL